MSAFSSARESASAPQDSGASLMCGAHGCPNRWSIDPPRMCSAHAGSDPHLWPQITQEQRAAETQRAITAGNPPAPQRFVTPDPLKLRRYLRRLAGGIASAQRSPRGWAERLRGREESGDRLTPAQKEAWRAVVGRVEEAEA